MVGSSFFFNFRKEVEHIVDLAAEFFLHETSRRIVQSIRKTLVENVVLGKDGNVQEVLIGDDVIRDKGDDIQPQLLDVVQIGNVVEESESVIFISLL